MTRQPPDSLPLLARAGQFAGQPAIITPAGEFTYADLLDAAARIAAGLLNSATDLRESRVAFLLPAGFEAVAALWGIWRAGGIAVPLAVSHPTPELRYIIQNSQAETVIIHPDLAAQHPPLAHLPGVRLRLATDLFANPAATKLPRVALDRRALIIYTSGTTGHPKGVVSTHRNLQAQITTLIDAWEWATRDHILHVLPLHHVHGLVNVLLCALWAGAACHMLPKFDPAEVWQRILTGPLTLFMAVPTIYHRLIATWEAAPPAEQAAMSAACAKLRLMVSGSAALPVSVLHQWQAISGHILLERYGMTEIGMALSNPLRGERRPGFVGQPLPGVEIRLVDDAGQVITTAGAPGEIWVKSPTVFKEYWGLPEATAASFTDGWFRTGDIAVTDGGSYRIIGRNSVDIIKSGGYKISALEIEEVLRTHPAVQECAVVGLPDEVWGEIIAAAVVGEPGRTVIPAQLEDFARQQLAPYKIPRRFIFVADLPRNAMGKVVKPQVKLLFES